MAADLGKVGMRMRGDWSNSATYEVLDAVSYQDGLYIAKQAVPANTLPTNTTYWQVALSPTQLGVYEDISASVTPTGCTISSFQKAKLGAFVAITATIVATASTVEISGVPNAGKNYYIGYAWNNNKNAAAEFAISMSGTLKFTTNASISSGDSIRIAEVYAG